MGVVQGGLPPFGVPDIGLKGFGDLLLPTAAFSLVAFADLIATVRTFAQRHGYDVDANRELTALGSANVVGGLTSAFPCLLLELPLRRQRRCGRAIAGGRDRRALAAAAGLACLPSMPLRTHRRDGGFSRRLGFCSATYRRVMALLRRRGQDGGTKYRMREKMFAIGDDFWIENEAGERAFKVDGQALRIRDTFVLEDASGAELYKIQEKKLAIRDKMEIERGEATVATVKKALITPLRDRFSIEVAEGEDMEAKGNIVDHEYKIERSGDKVAEVSKRWFRIRDTYGIEIAPGQDDALVLAVTVCLDQMGSG